MMEVRLRTLTPIWTGGVETGKMDRIHETGIIGSLRWWYEVLVRGLGGSACDPTEHGCPDKDGNYCDVCAVFGTTGLQRAFRLSGAAWQNEHHQRRLTVKVNNNKGWFLGRGFLGQEDVCFVPLRRVEGWKDDDLLQILRLTLKLIECWGGLGARTQQGYGVVAFDENGKPLVLDVEQGLQAFGKLKERSKRLNIQNENNWPSLDKFFLAKVRFSLSEDPQKWIKARTSKIEPDQELQWYLNQATNTQRSKVLPLAPVVRYHLRALVKRNYSSKDELRHILMGELGRKSLIHVSHCYPIDDQWEFRIWGWIPDELPGNVGRKDVLKILYQWLGINENDKRQWRTDSNGALWKEVGISSPQVYWFEKKQKENAQDYLRALIEGCNKEKKQ